MLLILKTRRINKYPSHNGPELALTYHVFKIQLILGTENSRFCDGTEGESGFDCHQL
jgi:hypothetical protein